MLFCILFIADVVGGRMHIHKIFIFPEECTVPYVLAYDDLLSGPFKIFYDCSQKIGGDVATIAKLVQECFINQRAFLVMASKSQRPLDSELPQVLLTVVLLYLKGVRVNLKE